MLDELDDDGDSDDDDGTSGSSAGSGNAIRTSNERSPLSLSRRASNERAEAGDRETLTSNFRPSLTGSGASRPESRMQATLSRTRCRTRPDDAS